MKRISILIVLAVALLRFSAQARQYTVQDLGTLGGDNYNAAWAIDGSMIAGESQLASGDNHAFLWTKASGMRDLGTLGGDFSRANDVNSKGAAVGVARTADGETHAFLWTKAAGMQDLGTLGGDFSEAYSINEKGHVVGMSHDANGDRVAFYWDGMMHRIDIGIPANLAVAINDRDEVIVLGPGGSFTWNAFTGNMRKLPFSGKELNNRCQVVGSVAGSLGKRAILWQNGVAEVLPLTTPIEDWLGINEQVATAISSSGLIVGNNDVLKYSMRNFKADYHAFIWQKGQETQLPRLYPRRYTKAYDVSSDGMVVGQAKDRFNQWRAVVWIRNY